MRAPKKILGAIAGISMLATTLGIGSAAFAASPTYYDIYDLTHLAQAAANGLYTAGIMNGTAPGKFSPDGIVTRAQAVKFVVNLSGVHLEYPKTPSYKDVGTGSQYYPYIETALQDGFLTGYAGSSGNFNPSDPVTRVDLAILVINALGEQSVAQSMATDTTTYAKFKDLSKVPSGDLGYANAGMKLGFVPPLNAKLYAPNGKVNREQLAVGLWRGYLALTAAAPASASISGSATSVGVGQADILTTTVKNKAGKALTTAQMAGYTVSYSVTGSNASSATVSSNGVFVATASGNYTVQATISGGLLSSPLTTTTTVGVYGTATALQVKVANASIAANQAATTTVTVTAVDANGVPVGNFNNNVTLTDTNSATEIVNPATGNAQAGSVTVAASSGVATFTVQSSNLLAGATDTLTAQATGSNNVALTPGTATISTVLPTATQVGLSASVPVLSANTQTSTIVTVQIQDESGVEYSGQTAPVTLTLTGPGSFSSTSSLTTESLDVFGQTQVTVYSQIGQAGTINVTATSPNLTSKPLSIPSYVNTTPSAIKVSATPGSGYTLYTVQLVDTQGNPVAFVNGLAANDAITITDNTSTTGGSLVYEGYVNGAPSGSAPSTLTNGTASFTVQNTSTGTSPVTLTVTDTTRNLTATTSYSFSVGSASTVAVTPSMGTSVQAPQGGTVTVSAQVTDSAGNAVAGAGQVVTFGFFANTSGATYSNNSSTYTTATNAQGVATATITVPANAAGSFIPEAQYGSSAAVEGGTYTPVSPASIATTLTLGTGAAVNYPSNGILTAGTIITGLTVTTSNAVALPIATTDVIQMVTSNPSVLRLNGGVYASGTTNTVNITHASATTVNLDSIQGLMAGTATVTVTDITSPSQPKVTLTFTVQPTTTPGTPQINYNGTAISASSPLTVNANSPVAVQVVWVDQGGNPIPAAANEWLALKDTNGGAFTAISGGAPITEVEIPQGQASVTVYYTNSIAGSYNLAGEAIVASPTKVTAGFGTTTPTAGSSDTVTLSVTDQNGNPYLGLVNPVTVSENGVTAAPGGAYGSLNGTTLSATVTSGAVSFTNGSASFGLVLDNAAAQTITFTVAGKTSVAQTITPTPAATLTGATYSSTNHTLTLTFNAKATATAVSASDLTFVSGATTADVLGTVTYSSGSGTTSLVLALSGETITSGNGDTINVKSGQTDITDAYGNALVAAATAAGLS